MRAIFVSDTPNPKPESRTLRETFRVLDMAVIAAAIAFVFFGSYAKSFGDTADSRLATVYALTHHGTWFIDRPEGEPPISFEQRTIDKVMVDGTMLSSKPPILPLLMTAEYLFLNKVFGMTLDDPDDTNQIIRMMSMTLVGAIYILGLIFFIMTLRLFIEDPLSRFICLGALAFGTQLWGYSTNLNNHMPAAGLLIVCLYFALGLATRKLDPSPLRFFLFGFTGALVITIDMPAGIFVLFAGLYLLYQLPRQTLIWTSIGAAIPFGVHFAIMIAVTGSPIPVQSRPQLYLYEASYWRNPRGIDALSEPKLVYLFHIILGRVGLFSLFPITFLGFLAGVLAWFKKNFPHRHLLLGGLAAFGILTLYYVTNTNNYGGEAFGFRWYIVAMPVLMLMAAPLAATFTKRWQWLATAILIGVSFYSAWECANNPWGSNREWTVNVLGRSYDYGPS